MQPMGSSTRILATALAFIVLAGPASANDEAPGPPDPPAEETADPGGAAAPDSGSGPADGPKASGGAFADRPPEPIMEKKASRRSVLVLEPRAVSYKSVLLRTQVGCDGVEGTKIKPERHLGLDRTLFLSPEINVQLNFEILGYLSRLHFTFEDETLHGIAQIPKDIRFGRTLFPAGSIMGAEFQARRARARWFQEVFKADTMALDMTLGVEYLMFRTVLTSPPLSRQKDVSETGLPILGARAYYSPLPWLRLYGALSAFYWDLGTERAGFFETALGVFVTFTRSWGFLVEFQFERITLREEGDDRVTQDLWDWGPALTLYACL